MASAYVVFSYSKSNSPTYVLIGRKYASCPNNGGQHALPGGRVNSGENGFDAAKREAYEETLLVVPGGQGDTGHGQINGHQCGLSGVQQEGFYVLHVKMADRAGLDALCEAANQNLRTIPPDECEFENFSVVSQEEATQRFWDDHDPMSARRATDWFRIAVASLPPW